MKNKKKIIIITGATSFLGYNCARFFLSKGFVVFAILRPESKNNDKVLEMKGVIPIYLDFEKLSDNDFKILNNKRTEDCIKFIKTHSDDITILHFGWGHTLDRQNFMLQMLNVDYSLKVLEFAKILKVNRFIFAGSQAEYSNFAYGVAKKQFADLAVRKLSKSKINFIHLRIFSVYGEGDRKTTLINYLINQFKNNLNADLSNCDYMWNFLNVNDFTNILFKLIKKNATTDTYDIASLDTRLLKDYIIEAKKITKSKSELNFGSIQNKDEKFAIPDITNLLKKIGKYEFIDFKKGFLDLYE